MSSLRYPARLCFGLLLGAALLVSGCDDLASINEDPNNPGSVPPGLQLPALQSDFSYNLIGGDPIRQPALWIRQAALNTTPLSSDNYDLTENDVNNLWEFYAYVALLKNATVLDSMATEEGSPHLAGVAKVLQAWTLATTTDLWGDIPWSAALNTDETTPAYDTQEEVYQDVFRTLDAAIADLQQPQSVTALGPSNDLLYGGDVARWEKLAHTLKARFLMRLSKAPGYSEATQAQAALDALALGFESNADDADFAYFAEQGAQNPWYQYTIDGKWITGFQLSDFYVNLLQSLDDPRLPIQARPAGAIGNQGPVAGFTTDDPQYVGQPNGQAGLGITAVSSIGNFYSAPDAALNWISYASALFVRAEATLVTQGPAAAEPVFADAIRAHMDRLGVPAAEAEAYLEGLPALGTLDAEAAREQIMTQKYIANFLNLEAYNDWRRTGYPDVEPVQPARIDIVPLRFPYPSSELNRNGDNVPDYVPLGFESMKVPVWWDTTVPPGALPNPTQ